MWEIPDLLVPTVWSEIAQEPSFSDGLSKMKYIVVSGGVVSGLGKGISISSIGVLLKASGLRVTSIKIDPYLNSDAGTMSPFEVCAQAW